MLQTYNRYNPNANPANTNYPNGSGKDESTSGSNDGTPLEMDWYNDVLGYGEALLAQGRLTPSGAADTALVSDRLDGMRLASLRVQTACDYTGGDLSLVDVIYVGLDLSTVNYVIDRTSLTRWSTEGVTGTVTADDLNTTTGVLSGASDPLNVVPIGDSARLDTATAVEISNGVSHKVVTADELASSDYTKLYLIVPGNYVTKGDEGNATIITDVNLPDDITTSTRYVLTNPFGNSGNSCDTFPELLVGGIWTPLKNARGSSSTDSIGGISGSVYGEGLVIQTGTLYLINRDADRDTLSLTGGTTNSPVSSAPCRVWVRKRGV